MLLIVVLNLSFHIQNIPYKPEAVLKNNKYPNKYKLNENDVSWEKTYNCKNVIDKYFYNMNIKKYTNNNTDIYGEIFKIHGQPATLIIINNKYKKYYIEEFIINKNLILIFDAGPIMRKSLHKKFKKINLHNSLNKNVLLLI